MHRPGFEFPDLKQKLQDHPDNRLSSSYEVEGRDTSRYTTGASHDHYASPL